MEISVIMPVHNSKNYLKECLESVRMQVFRSFELICVDDCSDEETKEILKEYAQWINSMTIITLNKCVGAAEARNIGMKRASGKYIIFLDSDDVFNMYLLEEMYRKIVADESDVCICGYTSFYINGEGEKIFGAPKFSLYDEKHKKQEDFLTKSILGPWNKLCRKKFLEKYSIHFQSLSSCNDVFFSAMVLFNAEKISILKNAELIQYRVNTLGQISSNRDPMNCYLAIELLNSKTKCQWILQTTNFLMWITLVEIQAYKVDGRNKEAYEIVKKYLCKNDEKIKFQNKVSNYLFELYVGSTYDEIHDSNIVDYKNQWALFSEEINNTLKNYNSVILWGNGKKGKNFQQLCNENRINLSGIADKSNTCIGEKNEFGYLFVHTDEVLKIADCIIASNTRVYLDLLPLQNDGCELINLDDFLCLG